MEKRILKKLNKTIFFCLIQISFFLSHSQDKKVFVSTSTREDSIIIQANLKNGNYSGTFIKINKIILRFNVAVLDDYAILNVYYDNSKKLFLQGNFYKCKKHGIWTIYHPEGTIAKETKFEHGKKHGYQIGYTIQGKPNLVEIFQNDSLVQNEFYYGEARIIKIPLVNNTSVEKILLDSLEYTYQKNRNLRDGAFHIINIKTGTILISGNYQNSRPYGKWTFFLDSNMINIDYESFIKRIPTNYKSIINPNIKLIQD